MAVTSSASGTQTATVSTEHNLGSAITTAGVYVLVVDTNALAGGDRLELRAKTKAKSGGTQRLAYVASYRNAQTTMIKYSVPVPVDTEVQFTLKQTAGTGRSFDWNILSV